MTIRSASIRPRDKCSPDHAIARVSPDFLEEATGNMVELTTPGQVGAHVARGGDYVNALYATYWFGHMLAE
jgi:hypothetical protein